MTVQLYDSRLQEVVPFVPLVEGEASVYVCGPTVQSSPHIGHLRSALVYDQLRRWLTYSGFDVTFIRNVTDIDDKILERACETNNKPGAREEWWALAYRYEREFTAAYDSLGIAAPSYEPRATACISEMIAIIARLIRSEHAYVDDGDGDVYFDTQSWPAYGDLTRQKGTELVAAEREPHGKRDPRDFALWKAHKPHEPESAAWDSPWGYGRPGWHIECSAMSMKYLGTEFDIHGGGLDLRFPHHENEVAQSKAAGHRFARLWMHNGLVAVSGQKMSKSLGNSVFAEELLAAASPIVVRYYLGAAHYRSTLEFHDGSLAEAEAAFDRIESFLERADRRLAGTRFNESTVEGVPEAFRVAMDDDLAVPQALSVVHETVRAGNTALDTEDLAVATSARARVIAMTEVLGINPRSAVWAMTTDTTSRTVLGTLVERLIDDRSAARESRNFAEADRIRDELTASGIAIEDTSSGARWSLES